MLLTTNNIIVDYGKTRAVNGVSIEINEKEIVVLMGPNGAGKSSVLKGIFGLTPLSEGSVEFDGHKTKPRPDKMVKKGMTFVAQGSRVFSSLSVEENLLMGAYVSNKKKKVERKLEEVLEFFPVLKKKRKEIAFHMSGGEQQILSLGRALMLDPKIMLLDEPSIGLAPIIVHDVFNKIQEINKNFGTSILIVEHNLKSLLNIADRGYILAEGKVLLEGKAKDIAQSDVLEKAFFGELA